MQWGKWWRRIFFLRQRTHHMSELEEEMQLHADLRAKQLQAQGLSLEDAQATAARRFGNRTALKEAAYDTWSLVIFENLWRDWRFALRVLRKNLFVTTVAVLTLACGIGANTAIFSLVDAVLLRPLPYAEPWQLGSAMTYYHSGGREGNDTAIDGRTWRLIHEHARSVDAAVYSEMTSIVNTGRANDVRYVTEQRVGAGYFRVLGVSALAGREFNETEDHAGGPAAAVVSFAFWKGQLHGKPLIANNTMLLKGKPYVVVGVMPPSLQTAAAADVWTPLQPSAEGEGEGANYQLMTRLKAGATWPQAVTEVEQLATEGVRLMHLDANESVHITLLPLQKAIAGEMRVPVLLLWGGVAVLLLICCLNIAGLLLSRGAARQHEIATRLALGGGCGDVVRQLLVEGVALSLTAGLIGAGLGAVGIIGLRVAAHNSLGVWQTINFDLRVFAAVCLLTSVSTLLFSVYPALVASRVDLRAALAEAAGRSLAGARTRPSRRLLVLGEIALGVALLITASFLTQSYLFLMHRAPGFNADRVITATLPLRDVRYQEGAQVNRLFQQILLRIDDIPGVQASAIGMSLPYERGLNTMARRPGEGGKNTTLSYVTPGYFATLRIPVFEGRPFLNTDGERSKRVAIINQTFARMYFGARSPIGQAIINGGQASEVVGVVADIPAKGSQLGSAPVTPMPTIFVPASQTSFFRLLNTWFTPSCIVRSSAPERDTIRAMQKVSEAVDPLLPFAQFRTVESIRAMTLARERFQARVMAILAGLSLFLAAAGMFGLVTQLVVERTREFGVRMALGASLGRIIQTAVWPTMALAAVGCLVGTIAALGILQAIRKLIWGIALTDPVTMGSTVLIVLVVTLLASLIPAAKLLRLNCAEVLREG